MKFACTIRQRSSWVAGPQGMCTLAMHGQYLHPHPPRSFFGGTGAHDVLHAVPFAYMCRFEVYMWHCKAAFSWAV